MAFLTLQVNFRRTWHATIIILEGQLVVTISSVIFYFQLLGQMLGLTSERLHDDFTWRKTGLLKDEEENLVIYLILFYYDYFENITKIRISHRF